MIEATSLDNSYREVVPLIEEPDESEWEKIGRTSLVAMSFIAISAFVPAAVKKRRIYGAFPFPGVQPAPEAAVAIEIPQEGIPERPQQHPPVPKCSEANAAIIRELFEIIDRSSTFQLTLNAIRMYNMGNILVEHNVHPFEFLKQAPREKVRSIFQSGNFFKIEGVMKGVRDGMRREQNSLERFIPAFAVDMRKDPQRIRQLTRAADWRGTVDYLFELVP